jgi:hypothetical protein
MYPIKSKGLRSELSSSVDEVKAQIHLFQVVRACREYMSLMI